MRDKERFGRVRTGIMKQLRLQYGKKVADRTLGHHRKEWKTVSSVQGSKSE